MDTNNKSNNNNNSTNVDSRKVLGITFSKQTDFHKWYTEMITKGAFIEYYDVSGCYILLPNSYGIWENIQKFMDLEFKKRGVKNVYFPLFITEKNLTREKDHIEGFEPEVAWVTKSGQTDLEEKIAVRPTSECAIYPTFSKMIESHNQLPLKYNQWANVVRWEFKDTVPFIRSREFLWQEGHTCYSNLTDAMLEVQDIISLYKKIYKEILAVPTIMGRKTEDEKFAGALETFTVETFIPGADRAIQAATAHCLGTNFSKMFDIKFLDENQKSTYAIQNSWGFTTRSIGIALQLHGDDSGAVIPPLIATTQIVIVPITKKSTHQQVMTYINTVKSKLDAHFRIEVDERDYTPGRKYNYWELLGTPFRLEIGINDVNSQFVVVHRRDTKQKTAIKFDDTIISTLNTMMTDMTTSMYDRAKSKMLSLVRDPQTIDELGRSTNNLVIIKWCGNPSCIQTLKDNYKMKSLCMPSDQEYNIQSSNPKCVICGQDGKTDCLVGRSY